MNIDELTSLILDQQRVVSHIKLIHRRFSFEDEMDYVLVGLRRAGKSFLLFQRIQELLASGVSLEQIIYVNFEDERLINFQLADFNNILVAANQITSKKHYFFFDEIQNITGWERFARRMADQKETVYITGSNSKMLGHDIIMRLGGRYLTKYVAPFDFDEFLTAKEIHHTKQDVLLTATKGKINSAINEYLQFGGLPESIRLQDKRNYLNNIYQNIYLADIIVRNKIRNPEALRVMVRKIAETVMHELSYNKLFNAVKSVGLSVSRNSIIDYVEDVKNAYLLFTTKNYFNKFADRESTPRYYFSDNGLLNIFLMNKDATLVENQVAIKLFNQYQDQVYYLKSNRTGIDVDFYIPQSKTAIQVAWTIHGTAKEREISNLVKLNNSFKEVEHLLIVTKGDKEETITKGDTTIHVLPLSKFLLFN
ncbi:ATP-binding protein [uncultured Limosilactobacillus sp.]|uniref:ATP-binding protein n=1 Tax=uncultured Limosilactobacillus sp. TaxID=2837629 RepID=UPI0025E8F5A6|nr:ATP-binding protein [uncultured Limosilactobacillus sp.]